MTTRQERVGGSAGAPINFRIPRDLREQLRTEAEKRGVTQSMAVEEAIRQWVEGRSS